MKKFVLFVVLVLIALYALMKLDIISPPEDEPPPSATTQAPQAQSATTAPATPQAEAAPKEKGAVDSVLEYGVGYTQFKAKQRSSKKLDDIQKKHNQAILDQ